jgi:hypothetical protein
VNALGDEYSGAEREINVIHTRDIAPFEHTLPDAGSLLVGECGIATPLPGYAALADLASASSALLAPNSLAFFALALLRFRPLASRKALPVPRALLALSASAAFLVLALPALSLARRPPQFTPLALVSKIALLTLALAGRALILANLALFALFAFLTSLASCAAWLTLLA